MTTPAYQQRRGEIEHYFDRTASATWARLTSDAPVGRIRATVRAGRDRMRATLLSWLPADLRGMRVLDAGCGTGALAIQAALRGGEVVAIDLSRTLVQLARERQPVINGGGSIDFRFGDMLDRSLGHFDYVVCMDSLIHYSASDSVRLIGDLVSRTERALLTTYAPSNPALTAMHAIGKLFPAGNRAPSIVPVGQRALARELDRELNPRDWVRGRTARIASGFYTSQALELTRS